MKNTDLTPEIPNVSRYCAPWDADGWYYVCRGFGKKSRIYSNSDVYADKFDKKYEGAEYIVTYDSLTDGIDDHQESDFYVERDSTVYVAFDVKATDMLAVPEWLDNEWAYTGDEIHASNGIRYSLYSKSFPAGAHVIVPGFSGKRSNYFILIIKDGDQKKAPLLRAPASAADRKYTPGSYRYYTSEAFNHGIPDGFVKKGDVSLACAYSDEKYKSVRLCGDASLSCECEMGRRVVISTSLTFIDPDGEYRFGAVSAYDGKIYCGGCELCDMKPGEPTSIVIKYDFKKMTADAEINHVFTGKDIVFFPVEILEFSCTDGDMLIDYLTVRDNTDEFICDEDFIAVPSLSLTSGISAELVPFPFEENRSLRLSSKDGGACAYSFPSADGTVTLEARIFVSSDNCVKIGATDEKGTFSACAALYKNSIFYGASGDWINAPDTLTPYSYYPSKNWYEIRFVIDCKRRTYDFWIDGALRAEGLKFCEKADGVSRIEFSCEAGAVLYVNRIRAYDSPDLCRGIMPGKVFDVKKFGAKGNGRSDDTEAINKAVAAAAYTGGTVYIHDGTYLSGEIKLGSDMTFFVAPSAVILGTQDHGKYPLREPGKSLCAHRQLGRALLYGENIRNITVTGGGMLDGNGKYRFKQNDPVALKRNEDARPDIIYIAYSDEINIENINFRRSAFWTVVPLSSRNITIKNLRLNCMNTPNRDGIDPVDCKNISVHGCNVMAGDDGLCFKSSDTFGCENVDVYDMMISSLASAIKFGTDTYYSLEKARFADCFIKNVNRCGVSLESVDGAYVSDVLFERIDITDASAPAYVVTGCRNRLPKETEEIRESKIRGVTFRGLNFRSPRTHGHPLPIYETMVVGQSFEQSIDDLTFENCNIEVMGGVTRSGQPAPEPISKAYPEYDRHGLSAGYAFTFANCRNPVLKDIRITNMISADARPLAAFFECKK